MKAKQRSKDQPERRRGLAEINLIGQKGSGPRAVRRRGCAQIFGLLTLFASVAGWIFASTWPR